MTTPDVVSAETLETKTKLNGKILKTTLAGALVDVVAVNHYGREEVVVPVWSSFTHRRLRRRDEAGR
jgi:hypothetical protein